VCHCAAATGVSLVDDFGIGIVIAIVIAAVVVVVDFTVIANVIVLGQESSAECDHRQRERAQGT